MIETSMFLGSEYPRFITEGFHAQYIFPIAQKVCKGTGLDIGCNREGWSFSGSIPIDNNTNYNAYNLPDGTFDYIFSSHCLEHLDDYVKALGYWISKLKKGGV